MLPTFRSTAPRARAKRFVAEYLGDLNATHATQAAIRAGYGARNADVMGPRLLGKVGIAAASSEAARSKLERLELDAARVLQGAARVAFFDLRRLFDDRGRLRRVHELNELTAAPSRRSRSTRATPTTVTSGVPPPIQLAWASDAERVRATTLTTTGR